MILLELLALKKCRNGGELLDKLKDVTLGVEKDCNLEVGEIGPLYHYVTLQVDEL